MLTRGARTRSNSANSGPVGYHGKYFKVYNASLVGKLAGAKSSEHIDAHHFRPYHFLARLDGYILVRGYLS